MQVVLEDIVAALSVRVFRVPSEAVDAARELSRSSRDTSLVDALHQQGLLDTMEREILDDLSRQFVDPEAHTATGFATGASPGDNARLRPLPSGPWLSSDASNEARYEDRGEHGRGGMGRVLCVWDRHMAREVALKELLPDKVARHGSDPNTGVARQRIVARFLQEAQVTGRLQHPSIIPVHEIGQRADGTYYYTMKFVRGQTLRAAISAAGSLKERMELLPHYVSLCQAMAYAHAHGVIHRDLKPSNVMIGEFGETLVIDWGLAKELHRDEEDGGEFVANGSAPVGGGFDELTVDGQLLGTPHYMAPEQALGQRDTLDERTDVYALGAVLYQLLSGKRPFEGLSQLDVLRNVAVESPPPPEELCPEVPAALAAICSRAMARAPDSRYKSAKVLADEIVRYQSGAVVSAYNYRLRDHISRLVQKHRPVVATAVVFLIVLSSVVVYTMLRLHAGQQVEHALRVRAERERYDLSMALAQRSLEEHQYLHVEQLLRDAPAGYRGWEWGRLAYVLQSTRQVLAGDDGDLSNVAISDTGERVASLSKAGNLAIWGYPDGQHLHQVKAHDGEGEAVIFNPSGSEIATSASDGYIRRWDAATGTLVAEIALPALSAGDLAYTHDGRFLLSGSVDGRLFQWNQNTGALTVVLGAYLAELNAVAVSPDDRLIAVGDSSGRVHVGDRTSGLLQFTLFAHTENKQIGIQGVADLAFSPDGQQLLSSGCDATAKLWRIRDGTLQAILGENLTKVWTVDFSPDGKTAVTCAGPNVRFWDCATGKEQPTSIWSRDTMWSVRYAPDGKSLLTIGGSPHITGWNLNGGAEGDLLDGHAAEANTVRFSPDGRFVASGGGHWLQGGDGTVRVWEMRDGHAVRAPKILLTGYGGWVNAVVFHPNGRSVSAGDRAGNVLTWDLETGNVRQEYSTPEFVGGIRCLAISPDGSRFAVAGWGDGEPFHIIERNVVTGEHVRTYYGPEDVIDNIAYSPNGRLLASGSREGAVYVWSTVDGVVQHAFPSIEGWAYGVAFSPDSTTLAASYDSANVFLWDLNTGSKRLQLEGLSARARKVTFSPDGLRVASCDSSKVRVWNAVTGAPLLALDGGGNDLAFSPDGRNLATAKLDGRVGLFQATDWQE